MGNGFRGFFCSAAQRFRDYMKNLLEEITKGFIFKGSAFDYSEINSFLFIFKIPPFPNLYRRYITELLYESFLRIVFEMTV
jgi:hypothetical protein